MNLISNICWLLILHLPVYAPASNRADSSFRFEPDDEYKYGIVPKRRDNRIYHLRAYYTDPSIWKPKNTHNYLYYRSGHLFITTRPRPRLPAFTRTRKHKPTKIPASELTGTPKHEEKYNDLDVSVKRSRNNRNKRPHRLSHPKTPTTTSIISRFPSCKNKKEKERLERIRLRKMKEKERLKEWLKKIKKEKLEKRESMELEELIFEEGQMWEQKDWREHQEKKRLEKERLEKERLEKERLEKERLEKERLEKERIDQLEELKSKLRRLGA